MLGIDLNSSKWCNMVFEGKDRQYGGYALRRSIGVRHVVAYLIVMAVVCAALFLPRLFTSQDTTDETDTLYYTETVVEISSLEELEESVEAPSDELKYIEMTPPPALRSSIKYTAPVIKPDDEVSEEELLKSQDELRDGPISISIADITGEDTEDAITVAEFQRVVADPDIVYQEVVVKQVDQLPQFPGGEVALMQYLGEHLKYPQAAADKKIHGQVVLRFVVTETGDVGEIQVMRSSNTLLSDAAIAVVRGMPRWVPGKKNGEPVAMWFAMPINFALRGNADKK